MHIDLHTHQIKNEESIQVLNIYAQDLTQNEPDQLFSAGLHPWHIGKVNPDECFQAIERSIEQKNMLLVGECGIDRSISTDFALQELYFKEQIYIAGEHNKPLIIHCVRAYSDILRLKKETKSNVPWIIHGYRGNQIITQSLIKHEFYFSVGEPLLNDKAKHDVLQIIPLKRLFFETDDHKISIGKIYLFAAQILKIDEKLLTEAIFNNFKIIFGADKLVI